MQPLCCDYRGHMERTTVRRTVELDCDAATLWRLISDAAGLGTWLGEDVHLDLRVGGTGRLVDDEGVARHVRVTELTAGERLAFTWWPDGDERHGVRRRLHRRGDRRGQPPRHHRDPPTAPSTARSTGPGSSRRRVALVVGLLAGPGVTDPLDPLFDALADPTRRSLLLRLVREGPDTASHLVADLPMTRQAVVKHLQALVEAGPGGPERQRSRGALPRPRPSRWSKPCGGSSPPARSGTSAWTAWSGRPGGTGGVRPYPDRP